MRAAAIVFPFRRTYRRLELEKRWWHRLCVVVFFGGLLCTIVLTAWVAYAAFAPQVAILPEIESGFSDEPHLSSEADVDTILTEDDRTTLPTNVPLPPQGFHAPGTMTLKQFGQRVKAKYPVYNSLDDEALAQSVLAKYPQYCDVIGHAPIKGLPPGAVVCPLSHDAQGKPITFDWTSIQPIVKLIQMPDGSTSRFAVAVSDDAIKKQWNHAKLAQTWKAVGWAGLITIASALFVSYLSQLAYRALLYVIVGNACDSGRLVCHGGRTIKTGSKVVVASLEYNKGALVAVWSQLSGATLPSNPRNDLVWAYVSIAIKHHESIYTLASQDLMASAFALLRPQIETAYRGLWSNLIATDEQIDAIRGGSEKPFPAFRQMAANLDDAYGAGGWLQSFADRWAALSGFTHSGLEQLGRQFRDDGTIGPNYPDDMVTELLVLSATASIGCIVPLFRGLGLDDKAAVLEQWLGNHPFYNKTETAEATGNAATA